MNKNITILILFHNKVDQTIECIDSFMDMKCKILILNNNSDSIQVVKLKQFIEGFNNVELIHSNENIGVSRGRNKLISHSDTDWLFFVDNDIVIKSVDAVEKVLTNDYITRNFKIICPRIFNVHDSNYSASTNTVIEGDEIKIYFGEFDFNNCFPGGASIVHRSIFDTIGMYDEEMFVGFEDYEFSIRAKLLNMELCVFNSREILLIHDHRVTFTSADSVAVKSRYNVDLLQKSFDHLQNKFGLKFNHDWQDWSKNQVAIMGKSNWSLRILNYVKNRIL